MNNQKNRSITLLVSAITKLGHRDARKNWDAALFPKKIEIVAIRKLEGRLMEVVPYEKYHHLISI
jgi:hypothetical protein